MKLLDGNRVLIVGGGPAGCFTALHLLRFAAQVSLNLKVIIFEGRDFNNPGPIGCNKCAGIISADLGRNLSTLGLVIPEQLIQAELDGYVLHPMGKQANGLEVFLPPDNSLSGQPQMARRIVSVYRGRGPLHNLGPLPSSFDGWLLAQAQELGAELVREKVTTVLPGERPVVVTAHQRYLADLVVIASGVNSVSPLDPAWDYRPPLTEQMAQDGMVLPESLSGRLVHIFFSPPKGLIFGGIIPKGGLANISLLGKNLTHRSIAPFLQEHGIVSPGLDGEVLLCGCSPRVAVSIAHGYYADRMVVVGDAAATRLFKDGIGSTFYTARAAAHTAVMGGISRRDFERGYRPVCQEIALDNLYGKLIFKLWEILGDRPYFLNTWYRVVRQESTLPEGKQNLRRVMWNIFTGDESYQKIFWSLFSPQSLWVLLRAAMMRNGE